MGRVEGAGAGLCSRTPLFSGEARYGVPSSVTIRRLDVKSGFTAVMGADEG